jgi:NAD(P)-dependent dehydrogenase (short-subunit alcohol dehydrogenase family)
MEINKAAELAVAIMSQPRGDRLWWTPFLAGGKSVTLLKARKWLLQELQNKIVLITGAGRGIGKRIALGFAAAGARVGLAARSKPELELTKLEIEHAGGAALHLRADVTEADSMRSAAERLRAHAGAIDVLVCAAAVQGPVGPLADNPVIAWADTIATNLVGVMHSVSAVLADMIKRRSGKIIILSGGGADKPRPGFSAYAASKAGVVRLAECLAAELSAQNIQVNCMSPGGSYTHMTDEILRAGERAGWREIEEAQRIRITGGEPAEKQIQLALFLASERSNHVTGKFLHVNDDWRKLESDTVSRDLYTLRRVIKG